ncbi:LysE family translocator [Ruegeria sp. 1NDH52C]|uniref:LysE family translocator n=1 Tax=Ruegeria alba TaxID=2916756 RepID=A0ABS9NUX6_9RHOB|nr:LysE family translocator [Ruegeria alba]MCE8529382.1 LysE family translocator [Ruegeria pomeroyi]MCG6558026.1 LysE family translocator [Ruegeria alba]
MELMLVGFVLTALAAIATPGPTVLLALGNGARGGMRGAVPGIMGAALSDILLITAAALGLGAVLSASALLFGLVKWAGVAYLAYLGFRLIRGATHPGTIESAPQVRATTVFRRSFLVAVTNPKGYLFFAALLPQFIDPTQPAARQYLVLAALFVATDLLVMSLYAAVGACSRHQGGRVAGQSLGRFCGLAMIGVAGSLALMRRAGA